MSEDQAGRPGLSALLRQRLAQRRRLRRFTSFGMPAVMAVGAIGLAFPMLSGGPSAAPAASSPSRILCNSWSRCDERGYNSYGYASHEWHAYWRMSPGDECTNYAAYVESTVFHVPEPSFLLGNGGEWAVTAAAHHVLVNHTPSVGAVAEWNGGTFGMGSAGHVGVVEAVGPHDRYIVISQQHMGGPDDYNWTLIKARYPADEWQEWPSNFIHFTVPKRTDVGYFSPRTHRYALRYSQTSGPANRTGRLGIAHSVPLIGDWRGTGMDATGFYNPAYGTFHLIGAGARHATIKATFGPPHMVPLVGDWKGTGKDGIGYYDRSTGMFYLRQSLKAGPADVKFTFGRRGMVPLAGDWNGDGSDGIGFYNPKTGIFNLRVTLAHGKPWVSFRFGPPHMVPIVGNWTGQGRRDSVGYYNPRTGTFYLRDKLGHGPANVIMTFGPARMVPLAGEWFGR
jgi:surface antigen